MKRTLFVLLALGAVSVALMFASPADATGLDALFSPEVLFAPVAAAPARAGLMWGRKREPMKTFNPLPAGVPTTATVIFSKIPRYPRTILGFVLEMGGTTMTKALISRVELKLGEVSIMGPVTGTEIDNIDEYVVGAAHRSRSAFFLPVDLTFPNVKEQAGEQIGGLDLTQLPPGELVLELELAVGVSAPTVRGDIIWGPPQGGRAIGGGMMRKLVRRPYAAQAAGSWYPDINLRGAIIARHFIFGTTVTAATVAAQSSEGVANTGDGAMGAIAVALRTRTGRYKFRCIEPGTNLGRFAVEDPDGVVIGTLNVATAFNIGGLSGTLADGATDFAAGDGFLVDVLPMNVNQNINAVEVKKNEDVWYSKTDRAARFEQGRYGRTPLSQLHVVDYLLDNHIDGVLDTANAETFDVKVELTAADTPTIISEVLARPTA